MFNTMIPKSVKIITFGWTFFIAENLILSENRTKIIEKIGNQNYHICYNSLSLLSSSIILVGFARYGRLSGPIHSLWNSSSRLTKWTIFAARSAGLIGLSQSLPKLQSPFASNQEIGNQEKNLEMNTKSRNSSNSIVSKCPIDFQFGKDRQADEVWGMKRITRHPQLFSLGLTCFSFALSTQYLSHLVFWSFPLAFAFIGGAHQDSRHLRGMGGTLSIEKQNQTSLIPFQALLEGRQSWSKLWEETKVINASLGVCIAAISTFI